MKLTTTKRELILRKLNLPVVGKVKFDEQGVLEIEDEAKALELIEVTKGGLNLIQVDEKEQEDLEGLTDEEKQTRLLEKINAGNLKELKQLARVLVQNDENVKYNDWNNLNKEKLQEFLLNYITKE